MIIEVREQRDAVLVFAIMKALRVELRKQEEAEGLDLRSTCLRIMSRGYGS